MRQGRDGAFVVEEPSAELIRGCASTRSGVSGSVGEEYATREREHPIPKQPQTREVSWYRVVGEVALHDRLEPSASLGHGIVHAPTELLFDLP